ncbi:hypothetical protein [Gemmatimonas sp.]|uniref:hypothetical protein n=1 Tax=Gemmatimonas sp. TaxID=1962908 RepID=UPI00391D60BA
MPSSSSIPAAVAATGTSLPPAPVTLQAALRALRPLLGPVSVAATTEGTPLERLVMRADLPVVASCVPVEAAGPVTVSVAEAPLVAAFLDGVQRSRIVAHVEGTPLVWGAVAAAVREREARQLRTWRRPVVQRLLLASRAALGDAVWQQLRDDGVPLVDNTDADVAPGDAALHPHALRSRALDAVALEREQLERQLAAEWCAGETRWLWIDGGVSGNLALTAQAPVFGVVKSHTTLYGDAAAVRAVLALREGERSPAFLVGHRPRRAVASWYLRVRAPANGDPLFGLVRVEVVSPPALLDDADHPDGRRAITALCNLLSSAILLERAPVSLPDARWDTLTYGVHAVETYLQSLVGP